MSFLQEAKAPSEMLMAVPFIPDLAVHAVAEGSKA